MCVSGVHDVVIGDTESFNALSFRTITVIKGLIIMRQILVADNSLTSF